MWVNGPYIEHLGIWFNKKHTLFIPATPQRQPRTRACTLNSQAGAGVNSEFSDQDFKDAGAEVLTDAQAVMNKAGGGVGWVTGIGRLKWFKWLKMVEVEKCHMVMFDPFFVVLFCFFMFFGGYDIIRPWTLGVFSCLNRHVWKGNSFYRPSFYSGSPPGHHFLRFMSFTVFDRECLSSSKRNRHVFNFKWWLTSRVLHMILFILYLICIYIYIW